MSAPRLPDADRERIWQTYAETGSLQRTYIITGFARNTVQRVVYERRLGQLDAAEGAVVAEEPARAAIPEAPAVVTPPIIPDVPTPPDPIEAIASDADETQFNRKVSGDTMQVDWICDELIETEDQVWERSKLDRAIWYVLDFECNAYQGQMRVRRGQDRDTGRQLPDQPFHKQFFQIKARFRRLVPKPFHDATEAIFDRIKEYAPVYRNVRRQQGKDARLLEIDLFDVHIGKLAWSRETGDDYDLRISERVFREAIEDILDDAAGFEIGQVLLPIGNDFYHIDGLESATTAGTRVDSDGRYAKIIEVGEVAVINAIEALAAVAPVKVLWVPGNHDRVASYHLARTVRAWFRNNGGVEVDLSPKVRKFYRWGVHLLGYTHGNREPHSSLPTIMATEEPELWAATRFRSWRIGHRHKSKVTQTTAVDTLDGVEIRTLQSLSGRDAWHYESGFASGRRAAEAFVLAKDSGRAANFQAVLREAS